MPSFDASSIVEGLDFKFDSCKGEHSGACWRGPENGDRPPGCTVWAPGCRGTILEPSDQQVGEFLAGLKKVMADARESLGDAGEIDVADPEQAARALNSLDPAEFVRVAGEMADLHAALCSGAPSREQILAVPLRRRLGFYNWLQGEVLNPEAAPGGGIAQVTRLPSRAAG